MKVQPGKYNIKGLSNKTKGLVLEPNTILKFR